MKFRKITENLFRFVIYSTRLEGDLHSLIKSKVSLSDRQKRIIARELLLGLKDIHDKGYVHSDIKLENILYRYDEDTDEYHIQISDLGLTTKQSESHDLHGTPCMFSPALFRGNLPLLRKFDIRSPDIDEVLAIRCSSLARVYALNSEDNATYHYNTPADDLWATGITLYWLCFNDYPVPYQELFEQRSETYPWLKMLLTAPRPTATLDVILETLGETPLVELDPEKNPSFLPCFGNANQLPAEVSPLPVIELQNLETINAALKPT
jgi:serine/threonine protein kinase